MQSKQKTYVMFGYDLDDIDHTAFLGENLELVEDMTSAKRFVSKKKRNQKGFGAPEQWLEFFNNDPDLNHNFKFHLVPVIA